jgi:hypothetical protein
METELSDSQACTDIIRFLLCRRLPPSPIQPFDPVSDLTIDKSIASTCVQNPSN